MSDHSELKRLLEYALAWQRKTETPADIEKFRRLTELTTPAALMALVTEIEVLTATGKMLGAAVDVLGPRCDQLKEEVEALIKRCDRYAQDPSGSKIAAIYAAAHGHLLDIHIIDKSGKSQALDAVFALRKDAERYWWLRDKSEALHSFYLSVPIWMTGVKFNQETVDNTIDTMRSGAEQ
ncbi:MAG: hypothetical protein V4749_17835 [Pseudomonadota bacterium]